MDIDLSALVARIDRLVAQHPGRRVVVGIVGAPGSGKSTLADALVAVLLDHVADWTITPDGSNAGDERSREEPEIRRWIGSHVAHVPMDGYHLADVELRRLGRAARKGAPDTFDIDGYSALLARVRHGQQDVWAPGFDREIEQPIAGSIPILRSARVVVTEGNYLLLDEPAWAAARSHLDEVWFYDLDLEVRLPRLIARHERFGKSPEQARAWANGPDRENADRVDATRSRADLILTGDVPLAPVERLPPLRK